MESTLILYPSLAMFLLTGTLILSLGLSRFIAIKRGDVSVKYYTKYTEGEQPERLHILGRHVQNHFEVPPLFHIAALLIFVTDSVSSLALTAAWLFVALRCLHSWIHLGSNNVSQRFFCFGASLICLTVMWACVFISLISAP